MNLSKVRKAVVAFATTTGSVFVSGLIAEVPQTNEGWAALIGGSVAAGALAALAVYKVRNAGSVNGSYPEPGGHAPVARRMPTRDPNRPGAETTRDGWVPPSGGY